MTDIHSEEYFVTLFDHRIFTRNIYPAETQSKSSLHILFLHEGLGSVAQWKSFPEMLVEKTKLPGILYDRFGYGRSDGFLRPRDYAYLEYEAQTILPEFIRVLNLDKLILFGHSDGGSISLIYASLEDNRAEAVITEAAHVFVEDMTVSGIRQAGGLYFGGSGFKHQLEKYHGEKTDAMFAAWHDVWLAPEFIRDWNITKFLQGVRCPTLVIQGAEDLYGSHKQVDAILEGVSGEKEELWVEHCAHLPHFQAQQMVLEATARFIESIKSRIEQRIESC
jgi:pimeloyl-ACP methyl ester carboxylesterase